jgi:hypothetical protein
LRTGTPGVFRAIVRIAGIGSIVALSGGCHLTVVGIHCRIIGRRLAKVPRRRAWSTLVSLDVSLRRLPAQAVGGVMSPAFAVRRVTNSGLHVRP